VTIAQYNALVKRVEDLERFIQCSRGEPGPAGPPGPPGPPGTSPDPAALAGQLPPIRIQTLNPNGTVYQSAEARLGDLIRLRSVPTPAPR
jgi:hypothetical protein